MKKNQVRKILSNITMYQQKIMSLGCLIVIMIFLTVSLFLFYENKKDKQYIHYQETSDVDYQVFLKENQFFDSDYLSNDNGYIASLINYINAEFNYDLSLEEKTDAYKYTYWMEAEVVVKEKDEEKPLYHSSDILKKKQTFNGTDNRAKINESISIDYNYYNQLIKNFVQIYGLDNTESFLNVTLFVDVFGNCENEENKKQSISETTLTIPLTTKTTAIDITNNLVGNQDGFVKCDSVINLSFVLILSVLFAIATFTLILFTVHYYIRACSTENSYHRKLKKILTRYGSFIQQLGSDFDFKDYQILKINSFEDMLEIRDTIKQPILFKESDDKTGAYFLIPSNTKILYVYRMKMGVELDCI